MHSTSIIAEFFQVRIHNRFSEALSPHRDESCDVLDSLLKSLSSAQSGLFVINLRNT